MSAPQNVFEAECPHCSGIARFPMTAVGKTARCPQCGEAFTLPARPSISTRVKSLSASKEQKVITKLFVIALVAFLAMFVAFLKRGIGPELDGHYWALGFIVVAVVCSQRLREMSRIAKTQGLRVMTSLGTVFLILAIACLGFTGRSFYRIYMENQEEERVLSPDEERAELAALLKDSEAAKRELFEFRKRGIVLANDGDACVVSERRWGNLSEFSRRRLVAAVVGADPQARKVASDKTSVTLASYDPAKANDATLGIVLPSR